MRFINNWKTIGLLCLTLGLAPFTPEPHIWGKLKWIIGGGDGMGVDDWWDVVLHGTPFFLFIRIVALNVKSKLKKV